MILHVQGSFVFVPNPQHRGCWIRCEKCVAFVACPVCGSEVGVPCKGRQKEYVGTSHADRQRAAEEAERVARGAPQAHCYAIKIGKDGEPPGKNVMDQALWADFSVATAPAEELDWRDDNERKDAAQRLEATIRSLTAELDAERDKVASLMQPLPGEGQGDLPHILMRKWIADYQQDKQQHRKEVAELKARIDELEGAGDERGGAEDGT